MIRSVPYMVSMAAIAIGIVLFALTVYYTDFDETIASARRLGLALPLILLPGTAWHALRTYGWWVSFPDDARPAFTRLIRVRLAADAIGFFTVRGVAGEPLKVVLLYDRTRPEIAAAAIALERLAFAVINTLLAGFVSVLAVTHLSLTGAWDTVFATLFVGALLALLFVVVAARRRSGDYLGRLVAMLDRVTGRTLESSRIIRFILDVEDALLDLLRGERRRLMILTALPVLCLLLMVSEVSLVLWAVGQPVTLTEAATIETFARLASIASAAIPANIGALEASNAAVVAALGLGGGGSLALARRIRALLWAALGLLLYPAVKKAS